jgi:hypothetical protein
MSNILCTINWGYIIAIFSLFVSLLVSISTIKITNNIAIKGRLVDVITSNRIEWIQKLKGYVSKYLSMVSYQYERKIPDDTSGFMSNLYEITAQIKLHLNYKGNADNQITQQLDEINEAFEKFLFQKNCRGTLGKDMISHNLIDFYQYQYPDLFSELYGSMLINYQVNTNDINSLNKFFDALKNNPKELEIFNKELIGIIDRDIRKSVRIIKYSHQKLLILTQLYLKTEWERVKVEAKSGSLSEFDFDVIFENNKKDKLYDINQLDNLLKF